MKTFLPLAALLVLPAVQPTPASACGAYGAVLQPVDSVVVNLVDHDPRVAVAAWRHLVVLGDEGVVRLESAVRGEQRRLRYLERVVRNYTGLLEHQQLDHEVRTELAAELRDFKSQLARTKRILAVATPLVTPLKKAVAVNAPSA